MAPDVSRLKQRHREGSKIAPKHAPAFCNARSRETMRKQSMRRLGRRIASPSAFLGLDIADPIAAGRILRWRMQSP
jgi:hypothetical protein